MFANSSSWNVLIPYMSYQLDVPSTDKLAPKKKKKKKKCILKTVATCEMLTWRVIVIDSTSVLM